MRTLLAILLIVPLSFSLMQAQSPTLMNYQGLARDFEGKVLAERELSLRISILKNGPSGTDVFSELHQVVTNQYGLFTLQVGGGEIRQGSLDAVKWGQGSYWLQVEMDENGGNNYVILGATQLLSVPYALYSTHSETADRVSGSDSKTSVGGTPSPGSPWATVGNDGTDPMLDFFGTTDITPIVIKTNGIERMRLTAYGKLGIGVSEPMSLVDVAGNMAVGSSYAGTKLAPENGLLVQGKVGIGEPFPNAKLEVNGEMIVGSSYTGLHQAPMNGALFQGRVGVGTPSPGSMLSVTNGISVGTAFADNPAPAGGAAIEGKVGIGTTIPKSMLGVNGGASIGTQYSRSFEAPPSGLIVEGSTGVGTEQPASKMGVAGNMTIGLTYAPLFNAPENGLLVEGAMGVGVETTQYKFEVLGNSFFDGVVKISDSLNVYGPTTIYDDTDVPVIKAMSEALEPERYLASLNTYGAGAVRKNLNVGVDAGVGRDGYIGRNLKVGGTATFKNLVVENYADIGTNPDGTYDPDLNPTPKAPVTFINEGETTLKGKTTIELGTPSTNVGNGALIVKGGVGIKENVNLGGQMHINFTGRPAISKGQKEKFPLYIEGARQGVAIKLNETTSNDNYYAGFWDKSVLRGAIQGETRAEKMLSAEYILMTIGHVFDATDAAVELISEVTDFRVGVGFGAVTVTPGVAKIVYATAKIIVLAINIALEQDEYINGYGISYSSGSGDYAEWLERENPVDMLGSGDIVGVNGGKISRRTDGAANLMVVSRAPIVLGNMPPAGREKDFEKCAFMGQVPVKVAGPVSVGDYILPSGSNNGIGIGVKPSEITAKQASQVVGVSWGSVPPGMPGQVIVAVGLPVQAGVKVVEQQQETIDALKSRMAGLEAVLRELIPDFDKRLAANGVEPGEAAGVSGKQAVPAVSVKPVAPDALPNADLLTDEVFAQALDLARKHYSDNGQNPAEIPMLARLTNDSGFRSQYLLAIKTLVRTGGDRGELERVLRENASDK